MNKENKDTGVGYAGPVHAPAGTGGGRLGAGHLSRAPVACLGRPSLSCNDGTMNGCNGTFC